ncbi:iron ABC transporter permease [Nocardioidaceae bacterium SCSIO 66511]|nr:iron ABC transporter permease [Nocardioidaceae bacterium SCSIO 66511]
MLLRTNAPTAGTPGQSASARTGGLRSFAVCGILASCLLASVLVAIGTGSAYVAVSDTARYLWAAITGGTVGSDEATTYQIVWQIRTPRVLLAAVVGAGLGAVGVAAQALVRNALADPFVLGISSGASVGAVVVSTFGLLAGLSIYAVSTGAFLGALAATVLVYVAASGRTGVSPLRLVLVGVAMSFGFQAVTSVLIYLQPSSEATSTVLFWSMGSFGAATWDALPLVAGVTLLGIGWLWRRSRTLDVLALGDESAASLGVDAARSRTLLFGVASLMTAAMVAVSGAIGFVGLIVPHIVRLVVGAAHVRVLAVAPLAGAVLMVWVDLISRTVAAPRELPLGAITALVGVPVFILLMRRRNYVFAGR